MVNFKNQIICFKSLKQKVLLQQKESEEKARKSREEILLIKKQIDCLNKNNNLLKDDLENASEQLKKTEKSLQAVSTDNKSLTSK